MTNLHSDIPTISTKDVMNTLHDFIDNGGYDGEELIRFCSYLTGASEDTIIQELY